MKRVEVAEAAGQLDALLDEAGAGEEVILTRMGKAVGRLLAQQPAREEAPIRDAAEFIAERVAFMRERGIKPFSRDELADLVREGRDR